MQSSKEKQEEKRKPFFSDQCKEIEENNRMGKTRDFFKKIRPQRLLCALVNYFMGCNEEQLCPSHPPAAATRAAWRTLYFPLEGGFTIPCFLLPSVSAAESTHLPVHLGNAISICIVGAQ